MPVVNGAPNKFTRDHNVVINWEQGLKLFDLFDGHPSLLEGALDVVDGLLGKFGFNLSAHARIYFLRNKFRECMQILNVLIVGHPGHEPSERTGFTKVT